MTLHCYYYLKGQWTARCSGPNCVNNHAVLVPHWLYVQLCYAFQLLWTVHVQWVTVTVSRDTGLWNVYTAYIYIMLFISTAGFTYASKPTRKPCNSNYQENIAYLKMPNIVGIFLEMCTSFGCKNLEYVLKCVVLYHVGFLHFVLSLMRLQMWKCALHIFA